MDEFRVTAVTLNLRSQPLIGPNIIGFLKKDQIVKRLEVSPDAYWYKVRTADNLLEGWASHKYLVSTAQNANILPDDFPWLAVAYQEVGQKEYPDESADPALRENPRILEYLKSTWLSSMPAALDDETDWCAAFVNWCIEKAGYEGTNSPRARSWLDWGKKIDIPQRGCVVVFWRNSINSPYGHVGFYLGKTQTKIKVLGGNQVDAVNTASYDKDRLLGYRLPGP